MKKLILFMMVLLLFVSTMSAENYTHPTYNQLVEAGAFDTMNNISQMSEYEINLEDYYLINEISTWDENATDYENQVRIISAPITYGASDDFAGVWFYVFLILVILIFTYGKSKSLEITCMVMMILSLTVIIPSLATAVIIPTAVLTLMYTMCIVGFAGILYSFIGE